MNQEQETKQSPLRLIIVITLVALGVVIYFAAQPEVRDGQSIFKKEGCVKCHIFQGIGIGIIDLTKVTEYRSDTWIRDQIRYPRSHDRGSGMPSFDHLSDTELDNLVRFLHEGPVKNQQ